MIFRSTFGPIGPAASQPIWPFGPPGPTSLLLLPPPPPAPEQSAQATGAGRPRAAPMVGPDHLQRREKIVASPLLHFPIKRCPLPSSIPGNRRLQPGCFEAPSTPAIEDPHTSNAPSLSPHYAHVATLLSRHFAASAPPPRHLPSLDISQIRLPVARSFFSPPHDKPSWPGAAARPSSGELHGRPWWPVHHGPRPALVHEPWTESMPFPIRK
jgi:hypothetical protein